MSSKKRARGEVDSSPAVCNDEREIEDVEEEQDDWSSDSDSEFDPALEVNVQFEARPIGSENHPAIRRLLQQLLLKGSVDVPGLINLIIFQDGIGSVIQVESELGEDGDGEDVGKEERGGGKVSASRGEGGQDDDEVCGVVSVINLTHHRTDPAVQSLVEYLLAKCQQHSPTLHSQLSRLLAPSDRHVGLLVNERYLNIPPHVAPPLLQTLLDEVKEASRKGLPYNFDSYILLARSYLHPSPLSSPCSKRRREGGGEAGEEHSVASNDTSNSVLHCQEYEILQEETVLMFSYPVSGEGWGCGGDRVFGGGWGFEDDSLQQTRTVMVIPASRLQSAISKLSSALS